MNFPELIAAHKSSRSYPELARAAGGVVTDKRLQQLAQGQFKEFPEPATIIGLAKALRVSETSVLLAFAESLGLNVTRSVAPLLELLPASVADLPENQVRAIAGLIYEFTEGAMKEGGNQDVATPPKKSPGAARPPKPRRDRSLGAALNRRAKDALEQTGEAQIESDESAGNGQQSDIA